MPAMHGDALTRALAPVLDELITPALVLDLDAVEHNVAAMIARAGLDRWRPHLKTSKQAVVIEAMLRAGIRHFKVATVDELELLATTAANAGVPIDVVVAYPLQRAAYLASRRIAHARPGARVHVLADSPAHALALAEWSVDASRPAVMLDVDLGMARTGTPPEAWRGFTLPDGLELTGLHGYDGHHRWNQRDAAFSAYDRLCAMAREASPEGDGLELITSGTHSYAHALAYPAFADGPWAHRVSAGTVVLNDRRSREAARDLGLQQAAFVAARVISARADRVTLDAGSKAVTPDAGDRPSCELVGYPGVRPQRASEEHLPCAVEPGAAAPALGELVWLIPDHVCTTVNLHREAVWIRDGAHVGSGPVAAAGHRPRAPLASEESRL